MRASTDRLTAPFAVALTIGSMLVAACGGGAAPTATPTAAPTTPTAAPVVTEAPAASATQAAAATNASTGEPSVKAPATVAVGSSFIVDWTGPNAERDYITIVAAGATKWTNEPYFYTTSEPSPGHLTAPGTAGSYEIWYVRGVDDVVLAKTPITVSAFAGSVTGPASVEAAKEFQVAWTGPNGPGDYITIVKVGTTAWSNEAYFYTSAGSPGTLLAPIDAGAYELWYVSGAGATIQLRTPITVTPYQASVDGPGNVGHGQPLTIAWTGPSGPGDYITVAPAGSSEGTYLEYCYATTASPCVITAPDNAGAFELRYVTGTGHVLATEPLIVK